MHLLRTLGFRWLQEMGLRGRATRSEYAYLLRVHLNMLCFLSQFPTLSYLLINIFKSMLEVGEPSLLEYCTFLHVVFQREAQPCGYVIHRFLQRREFYGR